MFSRCLFLIVFQNNTHVINLEIQDNWLEGQGGEYIAEMLKENCFIASLVGIRLTLRKLVHAIYRDFCYKQKCIGKFLIFLIGLLKKH